MTLTDLLTTLDARGALTHSQVKDHKTAIKHLATALGYGSPDQCPVDAALREETTWLPKLEAYWHTLETPQRSISAKNRSNMRNKLRVLFRAAAAHALLTAPLPPRLLTKLPQRDAFLRQQQQTSPYQTTYRSHDGPHRYGLPQRDWPPDVVQGWQDYRARCDEKERPLRATTFQSYASGLTVYLGYLVNSRRLTPAWTDLFEVGHLRGFVRWHADQLQRRSTRQGQRVATMIAAMAKVIEHPQAEDLADYCKRLRLNPPAPVHLKETHHWVSLKRLDEIADTCVAEARVPLVSTRGRQSPGMERASRFQQGLILKLLVRVPLRQRNVRELRWGEHLYQDHRGDWVLHFSGDALKIGQRGGKVNKYEVNLTRYRPELIPLFEEFVRDFRPRFPNAATSPYLFLTRYGRPFPTQSLYKEIANAVSIRENGKRFYPHLIRTIWATESLAKSPEYQLAAELLGDTVGVVM